MAIPNKKTVTISVVHQNHFPGDDSAVQVSQFFHIPDSNLYTRFSIQTTMGVIASVNGAIAGNHVNGVPGAAVGGGVLGNALGLAAGYGPIAEHDGAGDFTNITPAAAVGVVVQFDIATALPGGIVVNLTGIGEANGVMRVAMAGSAYSLGAPKGA